MLVVEVGIGNFCKEQALSKLTYFIYTKKKNQFINVSATYTCMTMASLVDPLSTAALPHATRLCACHWYSCPACVPLVTNSAVLLFIFIQRHLFFLTRLLLTLSGYCRVFTQTTPDITAWTQAFMQCPAFKKMQKEKNIKKEKIKALYNDIWACGCEMILVFKHTACVYKLWEIDKMKKRKITINPSARGKAQE